MTLQVYSARVSYRGDDRLNVTRKSGNEGLFLAPSWGVILPALRARRAFELKWAELEVAMDAGDAQAERHLVQELDATKYEWLGAWGRYISSFTDEMRASYRTHRAQWDALLLRPSVTLCCYCADSQHCHRTLLARDILPKLGAEYRGEREEYARDARRAELDRAGATP